MLDKKKEEFREKIRAFAVDTVEPLSAKLDQEQRFPDELLQPLQEFGLLSMLIPEEYGGKPLDTISYSIAVEEISRVCGSTGIIVAAHNSLGTGPIVYFGNDRIGGGPCVRHRHSINLCDVVSGANPNFCAHGALLRLCFLFDPSYMGPVPSNHDT